MAWPGIIGHDLVWSQLQRSVAQRRLASTFLFVGPAGIGKRTTARRMAQGLLCEVTSPHELIACQTCPACQQVEAATHPDLIVIEKPADRSFIPVELFIGDREHRMRAGLCHDISLKPFSGRRKIAIIDDADYLNQEAANCFLKTLEEPPGNSLIILIGTSQQRQLPTIRSRCQVVRFSRLAESQVAGLLHQLGWAEDTQQAQRWAARADGSLQRALELADDEVEQTQNSLLTPLSRHDVDGVDLAKQIGSFVDAAGKDAPSRRTRLRQLILAAISFYRHSLRELAGAGVPRDSVADQFVRQALSTFQGDTAGLVACMERCFKALAQVDANANLATLIPCWLDDLAQATPRQVGNP